MYCDRTDIKYYPFNFPDDQNSIVKMTSKWLPHQGSIVYVHCREEGRIGLYIPDDQEISRGPRDVPRAISRAEGNLKDGGDVQPILSSLAGKYWF